VVSNTPGERFPSPEDCLETDNDAVRGFVRGIPWSARRREPSPTWPGAEVG
jgi:hypothetical protein